MKKILSIKCDDNMEQLELLSTTYENIRGLCSLENCLIECAIGAHTQVL